MQKLIPLHSDVFKHSYEILSQKKCKIVDQFREKNWARPSVEKTKPDLRIVFIMTKICVLWH
jgi:23S rRNA G2445 N2-methylase RlmL